MIIDSPGMMWDSAVRDDVRKTIARGLRVRESEILGRQEDIRSNESEIEYLVMRIDTARMTRNVAGNQSNNSIDK